MDSQRCGSKHCAWVFGPSARYFVSYRTIVGFIANDKGYVTQRKYSVTTTKQITQCFGHPYNKYPEAEFQAMLKAQLKADGVSEFSVTSSAKTGW